MPPTTTRPRPDRPHRAVRGCAVLAAAAPALLSGVPAMGQAAAGGPRNGPAPAAAPTKDPDSRCLQCHGQAHIAALGPAERLSMVSTRLEAGDAPPAAPAPAPAGLSGDEPPARPGLLVSRRELDGSPHKGVTCVECHADAATLPHAPRLNLGSCAASCHEAPSKAYAAGAHSRAGAAGRAVAPTCASCHGGHGVLPVKDRQSSPHRLNSLNLCGDCHARHSSGGLPVEGKARVDAYLESTHGRGVRRSGLTTAATCADCHGAHGPLPASDPASTVSRANVPATCGKCHAGVLETYAASVHGRGHAAGRARAAVCTDCHTAHSITRAGESREFLRDVVDGCGSCHDQPALSGGRSRSYYQSYHESYHGQVTRLGGARAATCSQCHGAHDILPLKDPASRVAPANLVTTCGACHEGADASFVRFDPHADHRDGGRYPVLHGVWLYFMVMMSAVFTFFGLHTALWFVRSTIERRRAARAGAPADHGHAGGAAQIRRFTTLDRVNHALVAVTFFGLTATGIPLVFNGQGWARALAAAVGGIEAAGRWHRVFAGLLIVNLALHFGGVLRAFLRRDCSVAEFLFGPRSLLPRPKDARDAVGMFRWFLGLGPRPRFDRWTYWEKFDYLAEVGGSLIIGGSGLLLWFPVLAAKLVPGWAFNVAMVVHGYEALLAIGFIFTIHFFNAHVRPGVFPVDEVIFNGSMPEHEFRETRAEEYDRLAASGGLDALRVPAPPPGRRRVNVVIALASVGVGLALLALILIGGIGGALGS